VRTLLASTVPTPDVRTDLNLPTALVHPFDVLAIVSLWCMHSTADGATDIAKLHAASPYGKVSGKSKTSLEDYSKLFQRAFKSSHTDSSRFCLYTEGESGGIKCRTLEICQIISSEMSLTLAKVDFRLAQGTTSRDFFTQMSYTFFSHML
jgi:hypothetical protein